MRRAGVAQDRFGDRLNLRVVGVVDQVQEDRRKRQVASFKFFTVVVRRLLAIVCIGLLAERESPNIPLFKVPGRLAKHLLTCSFSRNINAVFVS